MVDVKGFWEEVRQLRATLPDVVFLVSVNSRQFGTTAGSVCECKPDLAAQMLVKGTHHIATDEQVAEYNAAQKLEARKNSDSEYKRKQTLALPHEELAGLLSATVRAVRREEKQTKQEKEN